MFCLLILAGLTFGCRESVCRRRRSVLIHSRCAPWEAQLAFCVGVELGQLTDSLAREEWLFDAGEECDRLCPSDEECLPCWRRHIPPKVELVEKKLLLDCVQELAETKSSQIASVQLQDLSFSSFELLKASIVFKSSFNFILTPTGQINQVVASQIKCSN